MGLLDEAIREHLELKRRSGADPTQVAREEQEALAPVFPDEDLTPADGGGDAAGDVPSEVAFSGAEAPEVHYGRGAEFADLSTVSQDTAELDMQAVMEEDHDAPDATSPGDPIGPPQDVPGQERLAFE